MPELLTQLLVTAFQASTVMHGNATGVEHRRLRLRALEMRLDNRTDLAEIQASLTRDMLHSLIDLRINAVQAGFVAILATYAEQAQHYMRQQDKYDDASCNAVTPLQRANYNTRLSETDMQLNRIRAESRLLYHEMNVMLLIIGGVMPTIPTNHQHALQLEGRTLQ